MTPKLSKRERFSKVSFYKETPGYLQRQQQWIDVCHTDSWLEQ